MGKLYVSRTVDLTSTYLNGTHCLTSEARVDLTIFIYLFGISSILGAVLKHQHDTDLKGVADGMRITWQAELPSFNA